MMSKVKTVPAAKYIFVSQIKLIHRELQTHRKQSGKGSWALYTVVITLKVKQ